MAQPYRGSVGEYPLKVVKNPAAEGRHHNQKRRREARGDDKVQQSDLARLQQAFRPEKPDPRLARSSSPAAPASRKRKLPQPQVVAKPQVAQSAQVAAPKSVLLGHAPFQGGEAKRKRVAPHGDVWENEGVPDDLRELDIFRDVKESDVFAGKDFHFTQCSKTEQFILDTLMLEELKRGPH